jgi:Alginate lyase
MLALGCGGVVDAAGPKHGRGGADVGATSTSSGNGGGTTGGPQGGAAGSGPTSGGTGGGSSSGGQAGTGGETGGVDAGNGGASGGSAGAGGGAGGSGGAGRGDGGTFRHPGVLVNGEQLDFLKAKIAAGTAPWKAAFDKAKRSGSASVTYTPKPFANVECGAYSNPNNGCSEEMDDATAAYTQALLWYFTGDAGYATRAIAIMNAWATTLKEHTNTNAPLQSAWASAVWPRAGEIIRYSYSGWAAQDMARFADMLKNVYLPQVVNGSNANGNWELTMIEATIGIGVFLDDRPTFEKALSLWRARVPAYIYLSSDGPMPVKPPGGKSDLVGFWYGQTMFVDGLAQETCRDLGHTQLGFSAMIDAAETAKIQGVDLYAEESKRIVAGFEFNTQYLDGVAVPSWLCGGMLNLSTDQTWEIGYNEFANRLGLSLPHTKNVIAKIRPTGTSKHMVWESLTHAEVGSVGLP